MWMWMVVVVEHRASQMIRVVLLLSSFLARKDPVSPESPVVRQRDL